MPKRSSNSFATVVRVLVVSEVKLKQTHSQLQASLCKELLCTPGIGLHHVDPTRPLYLHTDWSNYGMGALLGQIDDDGNERLCGCISRSLNESEAKYPSFYGELLCVVWALRARHSHRQTGKYDPTQVRTIRQNRTRSDGTSRNIPRRQQIFPRHAASCQTTIRGYHHLAETTQPLDPPPRRTQPRRHATSDA